MRTMLISLALVGTVSVGGAHAQSQAPAPATTPAAPAVDLKVGDPAPAFSLPGSDGQAHALADHVGKRAVVIAWFPKAFTGG